MPVIFTDEMKVAESSWQTQGRMQRVGQTDAQYMDSKHTTSDDLNRDRYRKGKRCHENMVIHVLV